MLHCLLVVGWQILNAKHMMLVMKKGGMHTGLTWPLLYFRYCIDLMQDVSGPAFGRCSASKAFPLQVLEQQSMQITLLCMLLDMACGTTKPEQNADLRTAQSVRSQSCDNCHQAAHIKLAATAAAPAACLPRRSRAVDQLDQQSMQH